MNKLIFLLAIVLSASHLFAATMVINLKNGKVISLETENIASIVYNEEAAFTPSTDLFGHYSFNGMPATLIQQGTNIQIDYDPSEHGKLFGKLQGRIINGFWVEDASGMKCSYPKDGRYYWGKAFLEVQHNGDLKGKWGYCDENPASDFIFYKK